MKAWLFVSDRSNEYKKNRLVEEAKNLNIDLKLVYPHDFTIHVHEGKQQLLFKAQPIHTPPAFIISLIVIEQFDSFAFKVLSSLEKITFIPNTIEAIRSANDKAESYRLLAEQHIPIPQTVIGTPQTSYRDSTTHIGLPFIIKPNYGLKGQEVALIKSDQDWNQYVKDKKGTFVVQQYIAYSHGRDLRTILLDKKIIGSMHRSSDGELTSNIATGGSAESVEIDQKVQELAEKSLQAVGLRFGSVDFLYTEDGYVVCEVNANPGFTAFEATTEINLARKLLEWCIKKSKKNLKKKNSLH